MRGEKATRNLIRLAYECSVDPRQWSHFLAGFAKTQNAPAAGLLVTDARNQHGSASASHELDPYWQKRYAEYYAGLNVWVRRSRHLWKPGKVLPGEGVIGDAEMERTEFYNDFLRPQGQFYSLTGVLTLEESVSSFIVAVRAKTGGPSREAEMASLREIIPHLQTALRLHHRIAGLETRLEDADAALDHLSRALIVTDACGRILHMNRRAEALLKSNSGLSAGADGLRAGPSHQTARLREFIARTASTVAGNGRHPGGVIQIQRIGEPPLKLQIAPLSCSSGRAGRRPSVAIFIAEPEQAAEPDPEMLGALLDLTPTEARLTVALVSGKTIQDFAAEAHVSLNTARTLLKRVFSKTGVSRQADLVRLGLMCGGGCGWE